MSKEDQNSINTLDELFKDIYKDALRDLEEDLLLYGTSTPMASLELFDSIDEYIPIEDLNESRCTCGAEKCGFTTHSDWCDKI